MFNFSFDLIEKGLNNFSFDNLLENAGKGLEASINYISEKVGTDFFAFSPDRFIFNLPQWNWDLYFTQDIVFFILTIISLILGVFICIWGYKFLFNTIMLIGGLLAGIFGMFIMPGHIKNPALMLFMFVAFVFVGIGIVYFFAMGINALIRKNGGSKVAAKTAAKIMAPIVGAGVIAVTLYMNVYMSIGWDIVLALIPMIIGLIYRHNKKDMDIEFHTYDEIYTEPEEDSDEPAV